MPRFQPETLERNFRVLLQPIFLRLDDAKESLLRSMSDRVTRLTHKLELTKRELETASPISILEKGYAIVHERDSGAHVTEAKALEIGNIISIRLYRGSIDAEVEAIRDEKL